MAGLDPAIHVFQLGTKIVDARDKPGHDAESVVRASTHISKSIKCGISGISAGGIG
jgi:hypothetical protein